MAAGAAGKGTELSQDKQEPGQRGASEGEMYGGSRVRNFHELDSVPLSKASRLEETGITGVKFSYQVYLCPVPQRGKPNLVTPQAGIRDPWGVSAPEPTCPPLRELLTLLLRLMVVLLHFLLLL